MHAKELYRALLVVNSLLMLKIKERHFKSQVAVSLDELVPPNNFYRQLEAKLDLSFVHEWVADCYSHTGRGSLDPVVFFKLQLIMYFEGIRSERELLKQVQLNLAYRWYIGYDLDEALPDHSSLTRIRDRLGLTIFQRFFEHVVDLCCEAGLVDGEEIFFDGSMVRANADEDRVRPKLQLVTEEFLQTFFETPRQKRKRMQRQLAPKIKHLDLVEEYRNWESPANRSGYRRIADDFVCGSDPDATYLRPKNNLNGKLGYHAHYAVDGGRSRIIVAALATKATVPDNVPMLDMLKRLHIRHGIKPRIVVGDTKYGTAENIAGLEQMGICAFLPRTDYGPNNEPFFPASYFYYDAQTDCYLCPRGYELRRHSKHRKEQAILYQAYAYYCNICASKAKCTDSQNGRQISRSIYQTYLDRVETYRKTKAYRKALRKRKVWIEPKFAEAKQWHRLRQFQLRSLRKVNIELLLIAAVQNLKQLVRHTLSNTPTALSYAVALPLPSNHLLSHFLSAFFRLSAPIFSLKVSYSNH